MVVFPPCKINLGLNVVSKRSDGYHNIETGFYPIPWTDVLEIIPSEKPAFTFSGNALTGNVEDNLCVRAYSLLKRDFMLSPVKLHLHKIIPVGAGLGGGSSDAAMTLSTLNQLLSLKIGTEKLQHYATQLGSDCAFFISPRPMLGTGKGETLTSLPLLLSGKYLVVVNPDIPISTAVAYRYVTPRKPQLPLTEILKRPVAEWKGVLTNDFEPSIFSKYPALFHLKERLYDRGATYASLSGSGSSVFGLFEDVQDVANDFRGMQIWSGKLA